MFQILVEHLKIRKGAILLPDPESGDLAPWSMRGLDRTTEHRLRLPVDELTEQVLDPNAAVTVLSGSEVSPLRPNLSQSEYDTLDRVVLVPFRDKEHLLGLLFITEFAYLTESVELLDVAFSAISRPVAALLRDNRQALLRTTQNRAVLDEEELWAIAAEIIPPEGENTLLVGFDISGVVDLFAGDTGEVDRFRIKQDVLRVIAALASELATIGTGSFGKVVLIFPGVNTADPDLVLHQISLQLAELFEEVNTPPNLAPVIREVDRDTERVDEVLSELI